jgi:DNA polymerase-3 subunit delta'
MSAELFPGFHGNRQIAQALGSMLEAGRIPQTILLAGPEGVGKATLVRRFASRLLGHPERIELDDLSREENRDILAEREKWPSEKRSDDPLLLASYPDFITFCPDGPLRQISIQQMRLVRERAQLRPLKGNWRVFLIDRIDRANPQAADSLLKTLEEPPSHLLLFLTAENAFDLPPTIRSRSVIFHMNPLSDEEMRAFAASRGLAELDRRIALAAGSPGLAVTLDLALYDKRRGVMFAMFEAAAGAHGFSQWVKQSESFLASKSEKLDFYFKPAYSLLEDLLTLKSGGSWLRNADLAVELEHLARRVSFHWIQEAVKKIDELVDLQRRNVQKGPSVDQLVVSLRPEV